MKSLRNIGLAVVLSLGASQVLAGGLVRPGANVLVNKEGAKSGAFKKTMDSVVGWGKKTFTTANAKALYSTCKTGLGTAYDATSKFVTKYGKKGFELVKNNPKTAIIVGSVLALGTLGLIAYKKGFFGWAVKGLLKAKVEGQNQQGGNGGNGNPNLNEREKKALKLQGQAEWH
jgi:hypothetical protein